MIVFSDMSPHGVDSIETAQVSSQPSSSMLADYG